MAFLTATTKFSEHQLEINIYNNLPTQLTVHQPGYGHYDREERLYQYIILRTLNNINTGKTEAQQERKDCKAVSKTTGVILVYMCVIIFAIIIQGIYS